VGASWQRMQNAIAATMRRLHLNTLAFYTDPDCVLVRPPLTLDQARMWATLVGITGQMTLASDKMTELAPERVELLRRICPVADIRPMDLFAYHDKPQIFDLKVATLAGRWDVVALFNWSDAASVSIALGPADLGLPPGRYVVYDAWAKQLLAVTAEPVVVHLPPASCRLLTVRALADRPQLVGTSRHVTQGADDLELLVWDEGTDTLRGTSRLVRGDPYQLRFTLPPGWVPASKALERDGHLAVLTLRRDAAGRDGPMQFARGGQTATARGERRTRIVPWEGPFVHRARPIRKLAAPERPKLDSAGGRVALTWQPSPGALAYHVFRNDTLIATATDTSLVDIPRRPRTLFRYSVAACDWDGKLTAKTPIGEFRTPPAADAWLDQLEPVRHVQQYGTLKLNRSHDGNPLTLGGKVYKRGLGTHAAADTAYELGGAYRRFEALCGVDDEKGGIGSCVFQVWLDGKKAYDSGVLRGKQPARKIALDVRGKERLRLVVTDAGDGINCDHADWANARLLSDK